MHCMLLIFTYFNTLLYVTCFICGVVCFIYNVLQYDIALHHIIHKFYVIKKFNVTYVNKEPFLLLCLLVLLYLTVQQRKKYVNT